MFFTIWRKKMQERTFLRARVVYLVCELEE